jgi:hypothetical protein
VLRQNEVHGRLELLARVLSAAERRERLGGRVHFRITVGGAEAEEIEAPHVEPGFDKRVAPGKSVKAMRDGECRRKGGAMHVEDGARAPTRLAWRQVAQE